MNGPPAPLEEVGKQEWKTQARALRGKLLLLQHRLRSADFPVIVVLAGVDGAGKHEFANLLSAWLDPRFVRTRAYPPVVQPAPYHVPLLRFWPDIPARGTMSVVLSGWYSTPLQDHVRGRNTHEEFDQQIQAALEFERTLVADGALLVKVWMHLDDQAQRERLEALARDPVDVWQVQPKDWLHLHLYADFMQSSTRVWQASEQAGLPWLCVDGRPERKRSLVVGEHLATALEQRLQARPTLPNAGAWRSAKGDRLAAVSQPSLDKESYAQQLKEQQGRLYPLVRRMAAQQRGLVLVFEGWDAAGKGGSIRRLMQVLDARYTQVHRIAAPDAVEERRHYLWRFATRMPRPGHVAIFDRSWYGRMLVERVEELTPPQRWQAAAEEICRFEHQWTQSGHMLLKFWLHISAEEQLRRFQARENDPLKAWKLTDEDWRNRERREEYVVAVNDMLHNTHTDAAPWRLIGANDKRHARVAVLRALNEQLDRC